MISKKQFMNYFMRPDMRALKYKAPQEIYANFFFFYHFWVKVSSKNLALNDIRHAVYVHISLLLQFISNVGLSSCKRTNIRFQTTDCIQAIKGLLYTLCLFVLRKVRPLSSSSPRIHSAVTGDRLVHRWTSMWNTILEF